MVNSGQKPKRKHQRISWFLKRQIAIEYYEGTKTLRELSEEYGIPNQSISRWAKSYSSDLKKRKGRIFNDMTDEEKERYQKLVEENERLKKQLTVKSDEVLQAENEALKNELEFSRMKTRAMEIIIDLAKEEYGIDLRKNSGAKQPAKLSNTTRRQQ